MSTTTLIINTVQQVGQMVYVDQTYGSDSGPNIGLRGRFDRPFLTPEAAKAAAMAGDLIHVGPGDYVVTANLAKNGVNWYFEQGAEIIIAVSTDIDMFGDGGTAMSYSIGGYGTFITDPTGGGGTNISNVFSVNHANSVVSISALDIINAGTSVGSVFSDPVHQDGGELVIQCRDILVQGSGGGYPVWWSDGRMSIHARNIRQLSDGSGGVTVSATSVNYPTGECFIKCDLIESATPGSYALHQEVISAETPTADSTAKVWIEALSILGNRYYSGPSSNSAIYKASGGNLYVTNQKLNGSIETTGDYGTFYLNTQKQQGWETDEGSDGMIQLGGALSHIEILECIDGGNTGAHIYVKAGIHNLNVKSFVKDSAGACVLMEGGTLNLSGRFDTSVSATSNPIVKTGGTLNLNGVELIAEGTRDSIYATDAQTVTATGSKCFQAVNAFVTVLDDMELVTGSQDEDDVATVNADGTWSWKSATGGSAPAGDGIVSVTGGVFDTPSTLGDRINGATAKTTPVDADMIGLMDSAASNVLKKLSWANIKATLKTYFDTLYSPTALTIRTYTGTTDALVLTDAGNWVRSGNAAANIMTIPTNASVAFPIGTQIAGNQYGAGQMSIAPDGGVTLNSSGGARKLVMQYSPYLLTKTGTNEWHLTGEITT